MLEIQTLLIPRKVFEAIRTASCVASVQILGDSAISSTTFATDMTYLLRSIYLTRVSIWLDIVRTPCRESPITSPTTLTSTQATRA
jgi:hypothetical protein